MIESNQYLIDCTAMSGADYSRVFEYLSFTYEACDVCVDRPRCFVLTRYSSDPPLTEIFNPPEGCHVYPL